MTEYIQLGGKLRPVSFAHRQQRLYEEEFSRPFNKDLQALLEQFAPVAKAAEEKNDSEVLAHAVNISVVLLGNLFYSAFLCGHNLEKTTIDFDVYDLTDWISADIKTTEKLLSMLISANSSTIKATVSDSKKKKA